MGVIGATSELMTSLAAKWDLLLPSKKCQVKHLISSFLWIKLSSWLRFYSRGVFQVNHDHPLSPRELNTIQDLPRSFTRRIFFVPTWRKTPTIKQRWCFSFRPAHGGDHWVVGYVTPWPRIILVLNLRCRKCRGPGLLRFYDHWCYHGHSFPLVFISWVVVIFHLHCSSPRVVSLCCQGCMCRSHVVFPVLVWRSFVSCGVLCFPWLVSRFCSAVCPGVSTLCFLTESKATSLFLHLGPDRKTCSLFF